MSERICRATVDMKEGLAYIYVMESNSEPREAEQTYVVPGSIVVDYGHGGQVIGIEVIATLGFSKHRMPREEVGNDA